MSFSEAISHRRAGAFSLPRPRVARPSGRLGTILAVIVLAAICLTAASWLLLRNSSLVAVEQVRVIGLGGYYDRDAKKAVIAEATAMTTMNFDPARIEQVAGEFVDVASVDVETDFPHAATVRVRVRRPVLIARLGGSTVTLSQSGEVITPKHAVAWLPKIEVQGQIVNGRVAKGRAYEAARLLGAAPDLLLRRVDDVRWGKMGMVASLKNGPDLYFGDTDGARGKWLDAAAVLASGKAGGASYLDLRVPGRTAVGGLALPPPTEAIGDDSTIQDPGSGAEETAPAPTDGDVPDAPQAAQPAPQAPASAPAQDAPVAGGAAPGQ